MSGETIPGAPTWSSEDDDIDAVNDSPWKRRPSEETRRRLRVEMDGFTVTKRRKVFPESSKKIEPSRRRSRSESQDNPHRRKGKKKTSWPGTDVEDGPNDHRIEDAVGEDVVFVKAVHKVSPPEEIVIYDDESDDDNNGDEDVGCSAQGATMTACSSWPWVQEIIVEEYRTVHFEIGPSEKAVEDDDVWAAFSQFGGLEKLRFTTESGGAVVFEFVDAVDRCLVERELTVDGVPFLLRRLPVPLDISEFDAKKIQVSGIFHLSKVALASYFSSYGAVEAVHLLQSRGFAFLTFAGRDAAEKSLLQQYHPIDGVVVEANPARRTKGPARLRPPGAPVRFDVGPRGRLRPGEFLVIHPFPRPVPMKVKTIKEEEEEAAHLGSGRGFKRISANYLPSLKAEKSENVQ